MAIVLNNITSGYNLSKINDNFQNIEDYINDKLLARGVTGVAGEAMMERSLDMNGNKILNIFVDVNDPDSLLTVGVADSRYYNVAGDTLTGTMNANGQVISNLPTPSTGSQAANKAYVDAVTTDLSIRNSKTLRFPEAVDEMVGVSGRESSLQGYNDSGKPIAVFSMTDTADLAVKLASTGEGLGDAMIGVKQPLTDAVARTQHDKNAEIVSSLDGGVAKGAFEFENSEAAIRAEAVEDKALFLGANQTAFPMQGIKAWNYLDGSKDRSTVISLRNQMDPADTEPESSISGFSTSASLSNNSERGTAIAYMHMVGPPTLLTSTNTTFTSTTVTCSDITDTIRGKIRYKQVMDVTDGSSTWTSYVASVSGTTITVLDAWYLRGSNGATTGTPTAGSTLKLVPSNKTWGLNVISSLNESSDSSSHVGIELEARNNKASASGAGYGYDALGGGSYNTGQGFQARGTFLFGFRNYSNHSDGASGYGFANTPTSGNTFYGFYDSGSTNGGFFWNNAYGITVKTPDSYAFRLLDSSNGFLTGMANTGRWQRLKYDYETSTVGGTISSFVVVSFVAPSTSGTLITMPTQAAGKILYVRNRSSTYSISLTGTFESGAGAYTLAASTTGHFMSDGSTWFVLSAS